MVTFANLLTITEFPMELGDNPSCSVGGPISMGWHPQTTISHEFESYEQTRSNIRKSGSDLIMSCNQRSSLLLDAGYSVEEIVSAADEAESIRLSRQQSIQAYKKKTKRRISNRIFGKDRFFNEFLGKKGTISQSQRGLLLLARIRRNKHKVASI